MSDQGLKYRIDADVEQAGKDIEDFSKRSRVALTNLTQVVQDLPYGFIGIQNNLPYLVSSFSELSKEVGGSDKAIVSLLKSLNGTVGLVFAFSAVTSIVTFLINEYGSLSNAYDAIISKTDAAAVSTKEYKKALDSAFVGIQTEKLSVENLISVISNANQKYSDRIYAFKELEKLNGGYIKGIESEKEALSMTNAQWEDYLKLFKEQLQLKAQAQAIEAALSITYKKFYEDLDKLNDTKLLFGLKQILKGFSEGEFNPALAYLKGAATTTQEWKNEIANLSVQWNNTQKAIRKVNEELGTGKGEPKVDDKAKKAADKRNLSNLRALIAFLKERQKNIDAANKTELESYMVTLEKRDQEIYKAGQILNQDLLNLEKAGYKDSESAREAYRIRVAEINAKYDEEERKQRDKIIKEASKAEIDAYITTLSKRDAEIFKRTLKFNEDLAKFEAAGYKDSSLLREAFRIDLAAINEKYDLQEQKQSQKSLERLQKQYAAAYNIIQGAFYNPLTELFQELFDKGTLNFEKFTQSIIANLKKLAAQIIASKIIESLISFVTPGNIISNLGTLGNMRSNMSLLGQVPNLGFGGVGRPTMNGLSGGGLALSGGVSLVLRGSDLIGSINRTNAQINRVG
jgi:DNA repair exonuclease SbcCD ATPase subunit